ncbi:MAG: 2-polyprenyl-6-methoxyphenol hydroxylase-like oxidoreductase [Candidatus Dormibacteraeota bacterium]|nr:2-polyprenyl-6-methoxyphenol hydroxylase-like oxidoreductase [Candidatus Dormibacteraeota bacterium]
MSGSERQRAVVVGASMAGLLAARVLAEHFGEVEIVERDRLPDGPEFRSGVPQSRHAHVLLRSGLDVLDRLFPGFATDLESAGAVPLEPPRDMPWLNSAGWSGRFAAGLGFLASSRELTESLVRDRLRAIRNVSFRARSEVTGMITEHDRVSGLHIRARDGSPPDPSPATELTADFVVDASGRMSKVPQWLEQLGYDRPREVTINSHLGYASRVFRPPSRRFDWKGLLIGATPEVPRGGGVFPLEGDRWMVTLGGYGRAVHPPIDEAGYMEFMRNLRTPVLFQALEGAEPLGPIYGYARTENIRRHYELLSRPVDRLVVVGDATCCFNPIYGQGMSVAGLAALALGESLRKASSGGLDGVAASAQRAVASVCNDPWLMATGEDLRFATTEGGRDDTRRLDRAVQRYIQRVLLRSNQDVVVCRAFTRVVHLLDPPSALFRPNLMARVLMRGSHDKGQEPSAR